MKTVKLITCNDAMKAHILQGALENEGIESILHNENFSTLYKSCVSNIAGDIYIGSRLSSLCRRTCAVSGSQSQLSEQPQHQIPAE